MNNAGNDDQPRDQGVARMQTTGAGGADLLHRSLALMRP